MILISLIIPHRFHGQRPGESTRIDIVEHMLLELVVGNCKGRTMPTHFNDIPRRVYLIRDIVVSIPEKNK